MDIDSPILLVGAARSGKSLLGNFLAIHKDTSWFSNYSDKFPSTPQISYLHRTIDWPVIGRVIKKSIISRHPRRFLPRPTEGEIVYHTYCDVTRERIDDTKKNVLNQNDDSIKKLKDSIVAHIKCHGKNRFITDQSDNAQRISLLSAIFIKPYVIHVIRDGRAVANEIVQSAWWSDVWIWWYGKTPQDWARTTGKDSLVMSGMHWLKTVNAVQEDIKFVKDRYLEIRYEELTENPKEVIRRAASFCGLELYPEFENYLPKKITNYNFRWKSELSPEQIKTLEQELREPLIELGYMQK
ncbi:MAG: hypothetical protein D3908_06940 [Candidatus Electrothrix sp. AUS4]|nr:hypothetical protein [Candidatus Electrothrix sp. AUS4]